MQTVGYCNTNMLNTSFIHTDNITTRHSSQDARNPLNSPDGILHACSTAPRAQPYMLESDIAAIQKGITADALVLHFSSSTANG